MLHVFNEGLIAPYTDIEFQLTKYKTMKQVKTNKHITTRIKISKQASKQVSNIGFLAVHVFNEGHITPLGVILYLHIEFGIWD